MILSLSYFQGYFFLDTRCNIFSKRRWGRRGRDRMVIGFTTTYAISAYRPIPTKVVGSNPVHGEVYSIQLYVIKFVSDLRQVGGFLDFTELLLKVTLITINQTQPKKEVNCKTRKTVK